MSTTSLNILAYIEIGVRYQQTISIRNVTRLPVTNNLCSATRRRAWQQQQLKNEMPILCQEPIALHIHNRWTPGFDGLVVHWCIRNNINWYCSSHCTKTGILQSPSKILDISYIKAIALLRQERQKLCMESFK